MVGGIWIDSYRDYVPFWRRALVDACMSRFFASNAFVFADLYLHIGRLGDIGVLLASAANASRLLKIAWLRKEHWRSCRA